MVDPWQLYNREYVSYAAWAIQNRFGRSVNGFHGQGNATSGRLVQLYSGRYRVYTPQPAMQ